MMSKFWTILVLALFILSAAACSDQSMSNDVISQNDCYTVTGDSVIQGGFVASAISPLETASNYRLPENADTSSIVKFRFSINSRDNEFLADEAHYTIIGSDSIISYGVAQERLVSDSTSARQHGKWNIRVDVSQILHSIKERGFFATASGDTIYAEDFKGIWIVGDKAPLTSDLSNLYRRNDLKLHPTETEGIYAVTIDFGRTSKATKSSFNWKIDATNPDFPQYSSQDVLVDATYNMSIDNVAAAMSNLGSSHRNSPNSITTRDAAYSTYLALAYLAPAEAMKMLKAKVADGMIIPDSGTGDSYPIVTDRIAWSIAAWEIYKVTGDKTWLKYAYSVIRNSIENDRIVLHDPSLGLMHGELSLPFSNSFPYPAWMQPTDIYESMSLSNNILFAQTFYILADMGDELEVDNDYLEEAKRLKDAINQNLWQESKGCYTSFLYGGVYPVKSPTIDNLGQALSVIFDIADDGRAENLIEHTPITPFGTTATYPRRQDSAYRNDAAISTFTQALWNIAAARVGNENALRRGLGAIYRAAALFGTSDCVLSAADGSPVGYNSSLGEQLCNATGSAAMIFRVFAGMEFQSAGIEFNPMIPICFKGVKKITGLRYRNAVIDITIDGTGNEIAEITIDGKRTEDNFFPATLEGSHSISITMKEGRRYAQRINLHNIETMPATPILQHRGSSDSILNSAKGLRYSMVQNGKSGYLSGDLRFNHPSGNGLSRISVIPCIKNVCGFMGKPHNIIPENAMWIYQCEDFAESGTRFISNHLNKNFVEISSTRNTDISIPVIVPSAGIYFIDIRYANGNGQPSSGNRCALRMLYVNTHLQGAVVMPQRGSGEWLNTGYSNMLKVELLSGKNVIQIMYTEPFCTKAADDGNTVIIDHIRIIKK